MASCVVCFDVLKVGDSLIFCCSFGNGNLWKGCWLAKPLFPSALLSYRFSTPTATLRLLES